jgi:hypothetical protein
MNPIINKSINKNPITLDDEWLKFLSVTSNSSTSSDDDSDENPNAFFGENNLNSVNESKENDIEQDNILDENIPKSTDIYISTKSKIAYLNQIIDLKTVFWGIKIIPYGLPENGVIKKQIKFNSNTQEDLDIINNNLKNENYIEQYIITSINNPSGRIKFKDIRKVSIGLSKKDLVSVRIKKKSAFYNCLVMIIRLKIYTEFKEFHIKVFNTGKMEIPGVQTDDIYELVLKNIIYILKPFIKSDLELDYLKKSDIVLINSNFNGGYFINREVLFDILKYKYNIQCIYDPCSYPGIQCKFYFNSDLEEQTGSQISKENKDKYKNIIEVSFMIFRTGSILIVGMCEVEILYCIYEFLKKMLIKEYYTIKLENNKDVLAVKDKKKKYRKKTIEIHF